MLKIWGRLASEGHRHGRDVAGRALAGYGLDCFSDKGAEAERFYGLGPPGEREPETSRGQLGVPIAPGRLAFVLDRPAVNEEEGGHSQVFPSPDWPAKLKAASDPVVAIEGPGFEAPAEELAAQR